MNKQNNIENVESSLQRKTATVNQGARKYAMSLAFAAVLTVLFIGAGTAQAQSGTCFYNSNVTASATTADCPIDNDSGYYYQKTNRGWEPVSYYHGASTNILYVYAYALRRWGAMEMTKGAVYIQTASGWTPASGSDPLAGIVFATQNKPPRNMNVRPF